MIRRYGSSVYNIRTITMTSVIFYKPGWSITKLYSHIPFNLKLVEQKSGLDVNVCLIFIHTTILASYLHQIVKVTDDRGGQFLDGMLVLVFCI